MERYDNCWFEIKTSDMRRVTRNRDTFLRNIESLSRLHDIVLYRIDQTHSGLKRSRIFPN